VKIKIKFMVGLFSILFILGIILNLLVREVLIENMENSIQNSMKDIIVNSKEYIKYRLYSNDSNVDEILLKQQADYINNYISSNYECDNRISDINGNVIKSNLDNDLNNLSINQIEEARNNKSVMYLKYTNEEVQGIISYPIYIDGQYIGIITVSKNFTQTYSVYQKSIFKIAAMGIIVFIGIFILAILLINKIIKPIIDLTYAVKKVGQGEYSIPINIYSKDEIGILSKEFVSMREKIQNQIQTIKSEKEKVEKLEEGLKRFFDNVTHELKTPLTVITGYADTVRQGMVPDESYIKRANERIYHESQRLHEMVVDLINISKSGFYINEEKQVINMKVLITEICNDMSIKAKKYSIEILTNISEGNINGRINKIRELMINVLDNGIKYSLDNEKIYVKAFCINNFYNIEIINKSEPIPKELINSIFEPFIRTSKSKEEGSLGLGLYICRQIARDHDGEIYIDYLNEVKVTIKIPLI
jgi:signal transduction histidine kinase